jgi:hypothetical protein
MVAVVQVLKAAQRQLLAQLILAAAQVADLQRPDHQQAVQVLSLFDIQTHLHWLHQRLDHQQSQQPVDTEFTNGQDQDR